MSSSPTALSLGLLREMGYEAGVVERNVARTVKIDFLGCVDIVAAHPAGGILAVQATTSSNLAARVAKAQAEIRLITWLKSGGRFEAWGWSLRGARGRRKLWGVRRVRASLHGGGVIVFAELSEHPAVGSPGALALVEVGE